MFILGPCGSAFLFVVDVEYFWRTENSLHLHL